MIRIWNPWLWIALIVASLLLFGSGTINGIHRASKAAQLRDAKANAAAAEKLAEAAENAREQERLIARSFATLAENHRKELIDAKNDRDRFIAGVRTGAIRLSIPVVACGRDTGSADTAPAAGNRHEARAELAPAAGAALAAIAGDGDDGIRQLNRCIDAYNAVREAVNVQAR